MAINIQDSTCLPLKEKLVHNNNTARAIELIILSLLISMLVYRVILFNDDQTHYIPWLLATLCESFFTFIWVLCVCIKWNQSSTKTYPDRLLKRVNESEFPAVDIFVTTADPILEPFIITMNTVLSLLAVDYPVDKLALYLSDDGCSPLTYYSLVETIKFAKVWVPFCKKYNVQVRAPFRYFTPNSTPVEDDSLEFQHEWKKMKNEYADLYNKMEVAAQRPFICDGDSDFAVFCNVNRSEHPTIIKVISENTDDLAHVIYISREKNPKHHHHYKAGAMNVLYILNGLASIQGMAYGGTNCFHRRKVIYGLSPNNKMETENIRNEDLHKVFGKSFEFRESAARILLGTHAKTEHQTSPSSLIQAAIDAADCDYEYGTHWGKKVGWLYGSTTEDFLTGLSIHARGWKSVFCSPEPLAFLGCAPSTFQSSLTQQKRWAIGLIEVLFSNKNPLLLTIKENLWFRQALAYLWVCTWGSDQFLRYAMHPFLRIVLSQAHISCPRSTNELSLSLWVFSSYTMLMSSGSVNV